MKLYELNEQWLKVSELLEEDDSNETLQETFEAIEGDIETKLEYLVKLKREHEAKAESFKAEKDYFAKKQKVQVNASNRLKTFIENQMEFQGTKKMSAGLFSLSLQKNPHSLVIEDESVIPHYFFETVKQLDKKHLKEVLQHPASKGMIYGAYLTQTESLRIK